jgi:protein-disulfide isomerase
MAELSVKELAAALVARLEDPFSYKDMNSDDIDWAAAHKAFWEEADQGDSPAAVTEFLRVIAGELE